MSASIPTKRSNYIFCDGNRLYTKPRLHICDEHCVEAEWHIEEQNEMLALIKAPS